MASSLRGSSRSPSPPPSSSYFGGQEEPPIAASSSSSTEIVELNSEGKHSDQVSGLVNVGDQFFQSKVTVSRRESSPTGDSLSSGEVEGRLEKIQTCEERIEKVYRGIIWVHYRRVEIATNIIKEDCMEIARNCFKLARHYDTSDDSREGDKYWKQAFKYIEKGTEWTSSDQSLNFKNILDVAWFCFVRVKFCYPQINCEGTEEKIALLQKGLKATREAAQIANSDETRLYEFQFLKALKEVGQTIPEEPAEYLKKFLDCHTNRLSDEYFIYANAYGQLLAGKGRLGEAKEVFEGLLGKKKEITVYLNLGKVERLLKNTEQALSSFKEALELSPDSLEIQSWVASADVENEVRKIREHQSNPTQQEVESVVNACNKFCEITKNQLTASTAMTSIGIPLREQGAKLYLSLLPEMANVLAFLQQVPFALLLYESMLKNANIYQSRGMFSSEEVIKLHIGIGALYSQLSNFEKAEEHLKVAIEMDPRNLSTCINLVSVYAFLENEEKLNQLWQELESQLPELAKQGEKEEIGALLGNFGTAYVLLAKEASSESLTRAECFYDQALRYDPDNWDAKVHWARVLIIKEGDNKGEWTTAKKLLESALDKKQDTILFDPNPLRKFQVYFCLSGTSILCGDTKEAKKWAIEAAKTGVDSTETKHLMGYVNGALKADKQKLYKQIRESIRKMEFPSPVGSLNPQSISISGGAPMGYHGTTDTHLESFRKEGIVPRRAEERQFKGKGFYTTRDQGMASYFAYKKAKEEGEGNPILIKIYAVQNTNLTGIGTGVRANIKKLFKEYQFIEAPIDGFEKFFQYYVFEHSLKKLRLSQEVESVEWDDQRFEEFEKAWIR